MNHWHLAAKSGTRQTHCMRLPRSSHQPLYLRLFPIALLLAYILMLPLSSRAATQQLVCTPEKLRFGAITVGQSETQIMVLTNTGASSATVSTVTVGGTEFSVSGLSLPASLAAGQSVTFNVTFAPTAEGWTGWTKGTIKFSGTAGNVSAPLWLTGSGVNSEIFTATPPNLAFGPVAVGSSVTLPVVLSNQRSRTQTLKGFQSVGSGFTVSGPAMPMTISPGQTVTLQVTFTPPTAVLSSGGVLITGPGLNIPLTGTGTTTSVGQLSISPAALSFGSVLVGETGAQPALFTATGGSVTVSSASSSSSQFSLPGASFPFTIGAGQSVQLSVAFTPKQVGSASANLTFSSNASDAQALEAATGTGTTPMVTLGWSASTSSVQGYNVYRGTAPGAYSKSNASLDANTSYTDTTVSPGGTYYYAATAVNSSGEESTYSSPVEVTIP
jgi:hypothetical protein